MAALIHDDRTPTLGLALPHPSNDLADDVSRVRAALLDIDGKFTALDALLSSNDVDLNQLQELVNAIKRNANDVTALLAGKAGRDELAAVIADKASRAELAAVARGSAGASLLTVRYDGLDRPQQIEETVAGLPRITTFTYNPDDSVATAVTVFAGVTRTETYSYSGGQFTGMTATEI